MAQRLEWQLVIAGPDQVGWRKKLNDRARQLGMSSRITWTGMLNGAVKWGHCGLRKYSYSRRTRKTSV